MPGPEQFPFRQHLDHPGWMFASHLIGLLLLLGAIVAVVLLLRGWLRSGRAQLGAHPGHWGPPALAMDPAVATVRARFAAGQIGHEEYTMLLAGLGAAAPAVSAETPPAG